MNYMTSMPGQVSPTNKSRVGLVVGIIVALLVLALMVYYARQGLREAPPVQPTDIQALEQQGTTDEVAAVEQDLAATDLGNLDKELGDIDRELEAALQ